MRSKKKHPVAVLRTLLNLGQKELAGLVGCSVPTIQSIELRRLKLSEDLALRIADQTDVDFAWLMKGDYKIAPLNLRKKPYQRKDYEKAQARAWQRRNSDRWMGTVEGGLIRKIIAEHQYRLGMLIAKASRKAYWGVVNWQIDQALTQLESRYGIVHPKEK